MKKVMRHWSEEPLKEIYNTEDVNNSLIDSKPAGFWLSDESANISWKKWCIAEEYRLSRLSHWTDFFVDLTDVLLIENKSKLLDFHEKFRKRRKNIINWKRLSKKYKGIIITPYLNECRFDKVVDWYYTWDVASGVFWDVSCLDRIQHGTYDHAKS